MATDKLSLYLQVNGADEATRKFKSLGKDGTYALNGITASARPVNSALIAVNSTMGRLSGSMGMLQSAFAAFAAGSLVGGIIETNKSFQGLEASLVTVEGSTIKAAESFDLINKMATLTPYSVENLTQAWIRLEALGLNPTKEALISFGNTSSAMNKDIIQFIEAVADASTMEFERLKEFGIKARQNNEEVSFTFQGTTTTVKKNAAEITKYLEDIGNNQFAGAMQRQMATLTGATSNLGDTFARLQKTTGDSQFNDSVINLYAELGNQMSSNEDNAKTLGVALATVTDGVTLLVKNLDLLKDGVIAFAGFKALQIGATATTAAVTATAVATRNMAATLTLSSAIAGRAATAQIAAMTAMSAAARGLSASMALVGGPLGIAAIAGFSIYQLTKHTEKSAEVASKYATELEEVNKQTTGLATATNQLAESTQKARKLALLEQLEQVKSDMAEVQDELVNGPYWSNNWLTNQMEKLAKDKTLNHFIKQYQSDVITLEELHSKIIKLGEVRPEYRDEALKFDERYRSFKALELAAENTQKRLEELNKPVTPNIDTKKFNNKDLFNYNVGVNVDDFKMDGIKPSKETIESLIAQSERASSAIGIVEDSLNVQLDPNSWVYGALNGLDKVSAESMNFASTAEKAVTGAFSAMEDSLVNFVKSGKMEFADFANSIIDGILRIQIQQSVIQPLSSGLSAWAKTTFGTGSTGTEGTTVNAGVNHTGGLTGSGGVTRNVSMELFRNAPRYHSGGLINSDEVPIIAQKGEMIVDRQSTNAFLMESKRRYNPVFNINIENNSGGNSEVDTSISENANGADIGILFERIENKIASDLGRDRGPIHRILNHKYKRNGANL